MVGDTKELKKRKSFEDQRILSKNYSPDPEMTKRLIEQIDYTEIFFIKLILLLILVDNLTIHVHV